MIKYLTLFAALLSLASTDPAPVRLSVSSNVLMAGTSIRVRCRVPRSSVNRYISGMVDFVAYDSKPLNGTESDLVTWDFWFHKIPCEAQTAACELKTDLHDYRVEQKLQIAGCGDGDPQ